MSVIYRPSPGLQPVTRELMTVKHMPYGACYKAKLHQNTTVTGGYIWTNNRHVVGIIKTPRNIRIRNIDKRTSLHIGSKAA